MSKVIYIVVLIAIGYVIAKTGVTSKLGLPF